MLPLTAPKDNKEYPQECLQTGNTHNLCPFMDHGSPLSSPPTISSDEEEEEVDVHIGCRKHISALEAHVLALEAQVQDLQQAAAAGPPSALGILQEMGKYKSDAESPIKRKSNCKNNVLCSIFNKHACKALQACPDGLLPYAQKESREHHAFEAGLAQLEA